MTSERAPVPASDADDDLSFLTPTEREERARIIAFLANGRVHGRSASIGLSRRALIQKIDRYQITRPRAPERTK